VPETFDVFAGYRAEAIAENYIAKYGIAGRDAENLRAKYAKLAPVIAEKSENGDSLSVYLGENTHYVHDLLFGVLLKLVIIEACIAAMFAALLSAGYELFFGTEGVVAASRKGRKVMRTKLAASLCCTAIVFAVLCALTLVLFFAKFDFSGVWDDNVSGSFNYSPIRFGEPFVTWHSFSFGGLLAACVGVGLGLALCFALFGFAVGTFIRSGYGAGVTAVALFALSVIAVPATTIGTGLRSALNLNGLRLWARSGEWFTDGGADILPANFEMVGLAASLVVFAVFALVARTCYGRRGL
jgi:hypothetical protein